EQNTDGKSPHSSNEPSPVDNFQLDSGNSLTENLIESLSNSLALLTQSYKSHLPQTNNQLRASSNARNKAMVQDGKVVVQDVRGRYNATNQGRPFQRNNARGNGVEGNVGAPNRGGMINPGQENGAVLDEEQSLFLAGEQVTNVDDDVDDSTENDLALNVDHIFEADECDAFDSDVDYTSDSNVIPYDQYVENNEEHVVQYEYHEVHEMQTDEQNNYVVDSYTDYTSNSNTIPYDQYMEDNEDHVVQRDVSYVRNDALMSILDEMHEQGKLKDKMKIDYQTDHLFQTVHMLCKPKSFYDEKHKVAIGYKNPVCLARAKQAQSALYNGHVLVTTNHTPTVIHDSEDTHDNNRKKAETLAPKPISALTVYPPNTPVKLVPRILPTKSITEGERGFEQTKRCYLTEVIPFFKTLKEHFVGVQKTLFKEVKEMEEIFDQMNNEVDKNTVDKQCAEIEKKNLLIENENLIVNCLSTQLLYDVENHVSDLEADMSKNLEHQIKEKDNVIRHLKDLVASVNDRSREPYNAVDVTALIEQNDCDRVELEKVKQHYKELYDSIKITRAHTSEKTSTMLNEIESLKAQLQSKEPCFTNIGYQWRPTGKKLTLGKLDCGSQWRPTGKKFALGEMCHLTKLSVKLLISRVYYVEGLGHNLFSVGQFCDSDLEVAFRKHTCFVRDSKGTDILKGSRGTNLYTISIDEMMKSSPICLDAKTSKSNRRLWHRRLNHLNFGTINDLARKDLVRGLPRLKFEKDHLCSACQLGKSKKFSHRPKSENTNMEVLHTLHMDLCGPMRVQSIKGKKYILVIVDDYSRFTWVKFLRSKDETPEFVTTFLKQIQVGLNKTVRFIRTDNGTEFVNQVMSEYYEGVGIFHQKSVPRTPQQNVVV
ncbi:retrovirus-related pol polyprotein from transposon TNT 1-94, partial [Tanacetum coccineum]